VPTRSDVAAERWARACFEQAPTWMRWVLIVGWRLLLLEGRATSGPTRIVGWPVIEASPSTVLQRRSRLGIKATLVFTASAGVAEFGSAMSFENPLGRAVWWVVAPVHRWVVRFVLSRASERLG
jgi:hypothetical protein